MICKSTVQKSFGISPRRTGTGRNGTSSWRFGLTARLDGVPTNSVHGANDVGKSPASSPFLVVDDQSDAIFNAQNARRTCWVDSEISFEGSILVQKVRFDFVLAYICSSSRE
jgi:hypothetical protein